MRILFIEDEWELNEVASEQLRSMGHQVNSMLGIEEARRYMDDHPDTTDLIIADHRLPDGQGVKFVIEARRANPRLKVAVVSGCLNDDDIALLQQERIHYFNKPLLYSTVLRALTRPPKGPIDSEPPPPTEDEVVEPEPARKGRWTLWPFRKQLVESTRR
jgi:DNA-binding NtrC family response regulator